MLGVKKVATNIQELPQYYFFEQVHELAGEKTREKLFKYILTDDYSDPQSAFNSYVQDIVDRVFIDKVVDLLEIKDTYRRRRQSTKKNWLNQLKKEIKANNFTPIHAEREVLLKLLDNKKSSEYLKDIGLEINDPNKYIKSRLEEIEIWAKDRESRLTDYMYLETKKKYQIEKAFENDFVLLVANLLINSPKNWISHGFRDLFENPIFADGKAKIKGNLTFDHKQKKKIVYDDYKLGDDRLIRSIISLDNDEDVQLDKFFLLDDVDSEIMEHVMECRDKLFHIDQRIVFDLRPLALRIYGNASHKAYQLVENRIKKIGRFSIEGKTLGPNKEVKTSFLYNLFQSVEIKKEKTGGRRYAEIVFSKKLYEQFIKNQTVQIYSPLYHRLKNGLSKILIYSFQKERIDAYLQGRKLKQHYEYEFFANRIRFRSKRIESNLKQIESSLQDFKTANIMIKEYKRIGKNGFEIFLTPLTQSEILDFHLTDYGEKKLENKYNHSV